MTRKQAESLSEPLYMILALTLCSFIGMAVGMFWI